jgi:hypothetical protein
MMIRTAFATAVVFWAASSLPAVAQVRPPADAINLSMVAVYNSPPDIASWPATTAITQVHSRPSGDPYSGYSFTFSANATWPDYTPPGWDGPIQYTVWALVKISGQWYTSGFIQMWRDRPSTGAVMLEVPSGCGGYNNFACNWAYDSRWGPMNHYQPQAGEQIGFFVSAGNARGVTTVTSVRERSNVVVINLPANNYGDWSFPARRRATMDFNGDGVSDIGVYRPSTGTWLVPNQSPMVWGTGSDMPVPGDYDGDGRTEVAVFRRATGQWIIPNQSPIVWGTLGDVPVPADYDGDGKTDIAAFRPSSATWFVRGISSAVFGTAGDIPVPGDYTGTGQAQFVVYRRGTWFINGGPAVSFGGPGDIPVPADYDGDGRQDIAVYRPSTGAWYVLGQYSATWGTPGDLPVPLDLMGTGRAQLVVYRPTTGMWFIYDPRTGAAGSQAYGIPGDIPLVFPSPLRRMVFGDFEGDRRADLTVFRPSNGTWYSLLSATGYGVTATRQWGASGDTLVAADYAGTGQLQPAVFRAGTWFINGGPTIQWGASGDVPVAADFDGDGAADLAVFRNGTWHILLSAGNYGSSATINLGNPGDIPLVGDYDGDGRADVGIFRNGFWAGLISSSGYTVAVNGSFGTTSDLPVEGDYDGDGRCDVAVYRPSTGEWFIRQSSNGAVKAQAFGGASGDVPMPADYDGDGKTDLAIFRPTNSTWYVLGQFTLPFGAAGDVPATKRP